MQVEWYVHFFFTTRPHVHRGPLVHVLCSLGAPSPPPSPPPPLPSSSSSSSELPRILTTDAQTLFILFILFYLFYCADAPTIHLFSLSYQHDIYTH